MKYNNLLHRVMEHVGCHGIMSKKLNKITLAKSSKGRFSLIFCEANNHNKLEMAAKQLGVDVDARKPV